MTFLHWGLKPFFKTSFQNLKQPELILGRIIAQHRTHFMVGWQDRIEKVLLPGRWRSKSPQDQPIIGDWVAIRYEQATQTHHIEHLMERKNCVQRPHFKNHHQLQFLGANIDILLIVCGLDNDFNINRVIRLMDLARHCQCEPYVIFNKSDLTHDQDMIKETMKKDMHVSKIFFTSTLKNQGIKELSQSLCEQSTSMLMGSSGVGKSSLINALVPSCQQKVQPVRKKDDKGQHTTSVRQMFTLPNKAMIIDCPGVREILFHPTSTHPTALHQIDQYAQQCRFRNCSHQKDQGCRVQDAVKEGLITQKQLEQYYLFKKRKKTPQTPERPSFKTGGQNIKKP